MRPRPSATSVGVADEVNRYLNNKMIRTYKLDDINLAFSDSASGETVKPVVVN